MQEFGAFGTKLRFGDHDFTFAGRTYAYDTVRGVEYKKRTYKASKAGAEPVYETRLRVIFASGLRLNISIDSLFGKPQRTQDKQIQACMANAAEWFLVKTFNVRMDAYMAAMRDQHYVRWGRYQISDNGDLFRNYGFCLNLRAEGVRAIMFPYHLACLRRPKVWWKRLLSMPVKNTETLDLRRDRDCFLYLMRRYVGLYWPDETIRLYRGKAADGSTDAPKETPKATWPEGPKVEQEGQSQQRQQNQQKEPPKATAMPSYRQHLKTLGLGQDATWDEVRTTYRQLARKHHPDLLRGRGASEATVKQAEEVLKGVNEAYGWLEDFYKMKPK